MKNEINEYACEAMDECINSTIMECLQEMNPYERLEVLKKFKEICEQYDIKEK